MICSIHQPNYIPYIGLFDKINKSEMFIFYDTAQYTKWDYHNRNKIKWPNWEVLLTVPVHVALWQKINEVQLNQKVVWKHLKTIEQSYKKSKYFNDFFPILQEIYSFETVYLSEFNINFIIKISEYLWIDTKFKILSQLDFDLESSSTQALIDICNYVESDVYISWLGWKKYLDMEEFKKNNIDLAFQNFKHPVYTQIWWDFIPYMSIIDLIFNEWKNSIKYIN